MGNHIFLILLLILTLDQSAGNSFFISGPGVFHVGVNEKVFVQMGRPHLNNLVTLYLEHETTGTVLSERKTSLCADEGEIKTVELMIKRDVWSRIPSHHDRPYVLLVAESSSLTPRKTTRVLVSKHKGYIFIQTNQPIYNPSQTVRYRIFTLDHTMRPHHGVFQISVVNAVGNRIMKSVRTAEGGIFKGSFPIPSVSKMGTWNITAHYEGDEENVASREFKIQKFVLPSFDVDITMEQRYILLDDEQVHFTISARYSHGEIVKGAYHCQFGVIKKRTTGGEKISPDVIKGLEVAGSVQNGTATVSLQVEKINLKLQNKSLADLQKNGEQLYVGVFVTNIENGEIQEAEVYLPIITHKYTIDLSQTRSFFFQGYPLDVVVLMRHPDGSPAAGVPVTIDKEASTKESWQGTTDQEGAVFHTFNTDNAATITVDVSANGRTQRKIIKPASSPSNSFLYMTFTHKKYSVNDLLTVTYNSINGPTTGYIYYMVLSRGIIIQVGSLKLGISARQKLLITPAMVPSFRLIGYYHSMGGDIIADSIWVDVREECEIKVKVEQKKSFQPGKFTELEFDLNGQNAKVALLAVDKAIYALNADNKLTPKQVFSTMGSADLGCSYNGGSDTASVLVDAGLSAVSKSTSVWRKSFDCNSQASRQRRAVDLQQEMLTLKSSFPDPDVKECCAQGFSLIPMRRTCQERVRRILLVNSNQTCADAFEKCCVEAERLRQKKMLEDAQTGFSRTASAVQIEQFFLEPTQYLRRHFPESFAFTEFDVNGKGRFPYTLPDSITTWEFQVITLSEASGFCVVKPYEVRAFKKTFVSLRLPYSVRRYEQLAISPVIYNYGDKPLQVAVHMAQTEGLCSPGSATMISFVNITVEAQSSQFVTFSAVPMVTGSIPITIRLYDMEEEWGIDAVEKKLNVLTEGMEQRVGETKVIKLDGKRTETMIIDGSLPGDTVPESSSNIFVSVEGDGFGNSHARNLLSPEKVSKLTRLPTGCLEQTMTGLTPTALALRYLDLSDQWFDLPPGKRDEVLDYVEHGYLRILEFQKKKGDGSFGVFYSVKSSNWVTALVVKVLSLVAQRQTAALGQQGRRLKVVPEEKIGDAVRYLLRVQKTDGSFTDPQPVIHRDVLKGKDHDAYMTAFITIALYRSLEFLPTEARSNVEASISRATTYLQLHLGELEHTYAIAITAYCLSVCLPEGVDRSPAWTKLQAKATKAENGCYLWTDDTSPQNQKKANAITIETTSYALLAAVQLGNTTWADSTACWLTTQENYFGGYRSSQDTIMALEALSEYELKRPTRPEARIVAEFTVAGRSEIITLALENNKEKVETDLKKLAGNNIQVQLTGKGDAKLKIEKAYHLLEPKDDCAEMSISVTVEGKVAYTEKIMQNYDYYDNDAPEEIRPRVPGSAIEWFDTRTRTTRDLDNNLKSDNVVTYKVCVRPKGNLTGMAIADITLLSGFMASTKDLDKLAQLEQYIAHYEVSYGRVLIYFNKLYERNECIEFDAEQTVPVGLLQPAPAVFYDYYEPNRKCTVFYSAPQRSKMISKLCSGDVCQCAERPCHKLQHTFKSQSNRRITKSDREQHACFFPTVDYAYVVEVVSVSVKSNFELYKTKVVDVLRSNGDMLVSENSIRVFAKRLQCKGQLDLGKKYLIMGKDGTTNDSTGSMQYLLESNTWVEKKPLPEDCKKSANRLACVDFNAFTAEYKMDGCKQ